MIGSFGQETIFHHPKRTFDAEGMDGARLVVELFGSDANGRKMIAWVGGSAAGTRPARCAGNAEC